MAWALKAYVSPTSLFSVGIYAFDIAVQTHRRPTSPQKSGQMCRLTFDPGRCTSCNKQQVRETKVLCSFPSRRRCKGARIHFLVERPTVCGQCSEAVAIDLDLFVPFGFPYWRNNIDPTLPYVDEVTSEPGIYPGYETTANDLPPNYTEARQAKLKTTSPQSRPLATTIQKLWRFVCGAQLDDYEPSEREDWMG